MRNARTILRFCCPPVHLSTLPESLVETSLEQDWKVQTGCPPVHFEVHSNDMDTSFCLLFPLKFFPTQKTCAYREVKTVEQKGGWCTQILVHSKWKGVRMLIYKGLKSVTEKTEFLWYTQSALKTGLADRRIHAKSDCFRGKP